MKNTIQSQQMILGYWILLSPLILLALFLFLGWIGWATSSNNTKDIFDYMNPSSSLSPLLQQFCNLTSSNSISSCLAYQVKIFEKTQLDFLDAIRNGIIFQLVFWSLPIYIWTGFGYLIVGIFMANWNLLGYAFKSFLTFALLKPVHLIFIGVATVFQPCTPAFAITWLIITLPIVLSITSWFLKSRST
ncbi:hypothetical protein [Microcystis aeruginosa]|jgi:hypothetical protein|uniref:hypothetical protein n=1 Tax=Microcystis aeruginosa TaxID=1126 RepID=UPI00077663C9|nr:hypothetical protein [Microcystis aeruginosa]KXS89917.1 hypothetical protein OA58_19460 [Microcystis aeruginosa NIES-88]BCU14363.1 hypothetical protein MAN88_49270 [Microcystis aeruginosa]GCA85436.1 hypothetical protein MiHa_03419 [Microcystis aeruginosa NIES-2522]